MQQNLKGDSKNLISFTEQNFNEKKRLQQFLIQNDISFVRDEKGNYEATIKLTQLDDSVRGEGVRSQSPLQQKDKQLNKNDFNKENRNSIYKKGNVKQDQVLQPNQNNMQSYLNDKINVSSYLNEQRKMSMSPSLGKLRNNSSEKNISNINNINAENDKRKSKVSLNSQNKSSKTPSRQSINPKGDINSKNQSKTPNNENQNNQSKQSKKERNYINQELSPYTTDFSTRWRLNRSRTPESPNIKQHIDISSSQYVNNRPSSQASNTKKQNKEIAAFNQEQEQFKKSQYLDGNSSKQQPQKTTGINPNKSQKLNFSKENTKNEENSPGQKLQFEKSTKLQLNTSQMLKKSTPKIEQSPERAKVISLYKVDNSLTNSQTKNNLPNQYQINLYEDASAFKNRSQQLNEGRERKVTLGSKNNTSSSILKNTLDSLNKSNILDDNKNQSKKMNSDTLGQSQALFNTNKTASFHKKDFNKKQQDTDQNFQTPSGKKNKNITSKTQYDKYPSSAEIMKNIQKNYMNPIKYPIVEEEHNYSPIESTFSPKIRSPSKNAKKYPAQTQKNNKQSQDNSPPKETSMKESKLLQPKIQNKSSDLTKSNVSKQYTPQKRGQFTAEDFSINKSKKDFTPEKSGHFAPEDFSPNLQNKQLTKNQNNNKNTLSPNVNLQKQAKKDKTPMKNTHLTESELSFNERAPDSNSKSQILKNSKINDKKNSHKNQNKKSRSPTPESNNQNLSQSDFSLNDRLSFFKNSRLSNMPDIKLKVKQNHNYSAVMVSNDVNNGSRPSSQQLNYPNHQSRYLDDQTNQNNLQNSSLLLKSVEKNVQSAGDYSDTQQQNKNKPNFNKLISFQDKQSLQESEPKHFSVDLALDEENSPRDVNENLLESQKMNRPRSKSNSRGSILLLNQNRKNSSLLKKQSRDQFEQDYFSFNSQNQQFSPQRMLSSSFMNINKNDPWLQVFKDDDLRLNNKNIHDDEKKSYHRYTKIESSPQKRDHQNHTQSIDLSDDVDVQKLSSNELVHYYQFILEKAKQNQFQVQKVVHKPKQPQVRISE